MVFPFVKSTGDGACKCCDSCADPYDVVCYSATTGKVLRCQYHGHGGYNKNAGMDISAVYWVTRISVSSDSVIVASMSSLSIADVSTNGDAIPIQKGIGGEAYWQWSAYLGYQGPFVPSPDGTWPQNNGDPWFLQSDERFRYRFRISRAPMSDDAWWVSWRQWVRVNNRNSGYARVRDYVGYVSLSSPQLKSVYYTGKGTGSVITEHGNDDLAFSMTTRWPDDNTLRTPEEIAEYYPEELSSLDFGSSTQEQLNSPIAQVHTSAAQVIHSFIQYNDLKRTIDGADSDPGFENGSLPVRCNMYPKYIELYSNIKAMYSGFMDRRGVVTSPRQHYKSYPLYGYLFDCRFAMLCQPVVYSHPGSEYFWAGTGEYASNGVRNTGPIYCGGWIIGNPVISGNAARGYSFGEDCGQQEAWFRTADLPTFTWPNGDRVYQTVRNIRGPFCVQRNQGEYRNRTYLYAANCISGGGQVAWQWWGGETPPSPASDPVQLRTWCVGGSAKLTIIDLDDTTDANGDDAYLISSDAKYMPLPRLLTEFTNPFGTMEYNGTTYNLVPQDIYAETAINEDDDQENYIYALLAGDDDPRYWRRICKYKVGTIGLELLLTITPEHDWQVFHSFAVKNGEIWAAVSASDESVFTLPTTLFPPLHEDDIPTGERFSNYGQTYP